MTKMNYGVPYQGSKNRIATLIMNELPAGTRFVDLMAGGCAMTHCAALSGKYDRVLCNDKFPMGSRLFRMAVNGELTDPNYLRWVSHEDFMAKKDTDPFVRLVFSFGNKGSSYMYSHDIEPLKKGFHYAVVYDDWSYLEQYALEHVWKQGLLDALKKSVEGIGNIEQRRLATESKARVEGFQQPNQTILVHLLRKKRMDQIGEHAPDLDIEFTSVDYREYQHQEGDIVYCDPPYIGTAKYDGREFDHAAFWEWARTRDYPVYVSEYTAPDDFISIWQKVIANQMAGGKTAKQRAIEHLFIHRKWMNGEIERIVEQIVENTGNGGK